MACAWRDDSFLFSTLIGRNFLKRNKTEKCKMIKFQKLIEASLETKIIKHREILRSNFRDKQLSDDTLNHRNYSSLGKLGGLVLIVTFVEFSFFYEPVSCRNG